MKMSKDAFIHEYKKNKTYHTCSNRIKHNIAIQNG